MGQCQQQLEASTHSQDELDQGHRACKVYQKIPCGNRDDLRMERI